MIVTKLALAASFSVLGIQQQTRAYTPHHLLVQHQRLSLRLLAENEVNGKISPHPPEFPPPLEAKVAISTPEVERDEVKETLQKELANSMENLKLEAQLKDESIQQLENKVKELEKDLQGRQRKLDDGTESWSFEKDSLLAKIEEFSNMLQMKEENEEEEAYQKERLQTEVNLLQEQIVRVQNLLKREQRAAEELKDRLADVNDAMEFQQMEFDKEKKDFLDMVEDEKKKLQDLQKSWQEDQQRFEEEKSLLEQQLDQERQKLKDAEEKWEDNQKRYEDQRRDLLADLNSQRRRLEVSKKELQRNKDAMDQQRVTLTRQITEEQQKLKQVEATLEEERERFDQSKLELEETIREEKATVEELSLKLNEQEQQFQEERRNLETALAIERTRLTKMEKEMKREKEQFEKEKADLEKQLAAEIAEGKKKKREMGKRYEKIRKELTALWVGAKNDARKEKAELTAKYEKMISGLETDLATARESSRRLEGLLNQEKGERTKAEMETVAVEERYIAMVAQRNKEISDLKSNLGSLQASIQDRQDRIAAYETSYREVLGLMGKVTGKKVKRSRLSRFFRRRKKN